MEMKLRKIKNENFRFYYLNFSESNHVWLDKNTRIVSFILDGQFEVSTKHWYKLYVGVFNYLQKMRPLELDYILEVPSEVTTRVELFLNHYRAGYYGTECGLYIKKFTSINKIIEVIRRLLKMYYVDAKDAYLVVEVPPKYEGDDGEEFIIKEKEKLKDFLYHEYCNGYEYYEKAIKVIDYLNVLLKGFLPTAYDNLYLLNSLKDYTVYSHKILNNYLFFLKDMEYTKKDYEIVVKWLECARFFAGDIFRIDPIEIGEMTIEYENKIIPVTLKTYFINKNSDVDNNNQ